MCIFVLHLDGTEETAHRAAGAVVCAAVRSPDGKRLFEKGHVLGREDLPALASLKGGQLSLVMPEEGDIGEDEAAMRLARAAAGPGVEVSGPVGARARLVSLQRGLLRVDAETLARMNEVGSVSVYTLFDSRPVEEGETVAEAKVTPLLVPADDIEQAEAYATTPPVSVLPFRPARAAALVRERISTAQSRRMAEGLASKLRWFGSTLEAVRYAVPEAPPETLASAMRELIEGGAQMLFVSGGSASDPADPLLNALDHLPSRIERVGIPVHPGSMLWLAYAGEVAVLGVPSCGMFSEATAVDLVLPRLLTGRQVTNETFASLGHGGLLKGSDWRFPGYGEERVESG